MNEQTDNKIKCELRRVSTKHGLRTDKVVGHCVNPPKVGKRFIMTSTPLVEGALVRLIETSVVQTISPRPDGLVFHTEFSTYSYQELE